MTHYLYTKGDMVVVVAIALVFSTHGHFVLLKRPCGGSLKPCGHEKEGGVSHGAHAQWQRLSARDLSKYIKIE